MIDQVPQQTQKQRTQKPETPVLPEVLSVKQLGSFLSLSRATIYRLLSVGDMPAQIKLSTNRVGWLRSDIMSWLESKKVASISDTHQPN